MNRRTFLRAIGGTAILSASAGCLFGEAGANGLELTNVDSLAAHVATQPSEFSDEQQNVIETALPDREYVTHGNQPFHDGAYLEVDGEFYQASVTETGTKQMSRMVLGADKIDDAPDAVSIDEYPDKDREPAILACRMAIVRARESNREDAPPDRYVYVFRTTTADETTLLPTPQHELVEYDENRTFRLWVEERTLTEEKYTTTFTHVASSTAAFEQEVESEYVINLDEHELTETQRDIIETAIEEGEYTEQGQISDALNDLITLLRDEQPRGNALIKYDGEYYKWNYRHSD